VQSGRGAIMPGMEVTVPLGVLVAASAVAGLCWLIRGRRALGTPTDRAAFATLHAASLAAPPLRGGLTEESARRAARHLRELLGTPALAVLGDGVLLAWEGPARHHAGQAVEHARDAMAAGRPGVVAQDVVACGDDGCPVRGAVVVPLVVDGLVVGALSAYGRQVTAGLVRAAGEVAHWVIAQLELSELDRSRSRLMEAELRSLRA
jgi:two-component system, LytTR family, sensor kinase